MTTNRRHILRSAFGAVALASGAQNGTAQTSSPAPNYARLSTAVINSNGLAAGNLWTGMNTRVLKSDDFVRASSLLRAMSAHFDEIGVNAYLNTQLTQSASGVIPPTFIPAIGAQLRSYGILLTDSQIQQQYYSPDSNAQQQGLLYITTLGVSGFHLKVADSLDVVAQQLRLQEIATACGDLLNLLPSSRPAHANDLSSRASTGCSVWTYLNYGSQALTLIAIYADVTVLIGLALGLLTIFSDAAHYYVCG